MTLRYVLLRQGKEKENMRVSAQGKPVRVRGAVPGEVWLVKPAYSRGSMERMEGRWMHVQGMCPA